MLTAVDDRIAAAAPKGMVSASFQGDDACEEAAGLHVGLNNVEIAAVAAPRPLLLTSATRDWTRHTPQKELPAVKSVYRLFTADSNVENAHISGWHNGNRESRKAIYSFFDRKLKTTASVESVSEVSLTKVRLQSLLIGGEVGKDDGQLFAQWRKQAVRRTAMLSGRENRVRLRTALAIEGLPLGLIKSHWMMGTGNGAVLIVHPGGIEAAVESIEATRLYDEGRSILFVEFDKPHDDSAHKRTHLTFHLSEDAQRVRVLLSEITLLATQRKEKPQVVCLGESGPWCLAAAAASEYPVELVADLKGLDSNDESLSRHLFIPGLQRLGGVSMLENLAGISIREERTVSLLR